MTTTPEPARRLPTPLARAREGRWLAGTCAGLARYRDLPPSTVRAAFALAALVGGLGVLVYVACWLIIPAEGDDESETARRRGIVVLAQACAACVGLVTLGAGAAAATVFGFGWAVLVIAAAFLLGALVSWPRVGPAWALLPITALALPAVAIAAGGVRIDAQIGDVSVAPRSAAELPRQGYRSGLGTLLVDLRHTALPARGAVALRVAAGVRRTIVALPTDRCVRVHLRYRVNPLAARAASIVSGHSDSPFSDVTLFGRGHSSGTGEDGNLPDGRPRGPTLEIDFRSAGGSLYVRDYPDEVDPESEVDWPGYPVWLEPRPDVTGTPRAAARRLLRDWRVRRREQRRSADRIERLTPGPCAAKDARR